MENSGAGMTLRSRRIKGIGISVRSSAKNVMSPKRVKKSSRFTSRINHKVINRRKKVKKKATDVHDENSVILENGISCKVLFETSDTQKNHTCAKGTPPTLSCDICGKTYKSKVSLHRHASSHGDRPKYSCSHCGAQFTEKCSHDTHRRTVHDASDTNREFACDICDGTFGSKSQHTRHMKVHLISYLAYQCEMCDGSFANEEILRQHMKMAHPQNRPFQCAECGATFTMRKDLCDHIFRHVRNLTCAICNKKFGRKFNLREHMGIHTGLKPYKCSLCPKSFTDRSGLYKHRRIHNEGKRYPCETCGFVFKHSSHLKRHINSKHTREKRYYCDQCERSYATNYNLMVHKRIHSNRRDFECTMCAKKFIYKHALLSHIRKHTGEKPYKCGVCPKSFKDRSSLVSHTWMHNNNSPYICKQCSPEKRFSSSSTFKRHQLRFHNDGKKDFACTVCSKAFACWDGVRQHIKQCHQTDKVFKCGFCAVNFSTKIALSAHKKQHLYN